MADPEQRTTRLRIGFLFLLALAISAVFFSLISGFLLSLLMAAVLAGLANPVYRRLLKLYRGREVLASGTTIILILVLIVLPGMVFFGVLVNEAVQVSETAGQWVSHQVQEREHLEERLRNLPLVEQLLPYQDQILAKAGQLAGKIGGFVAQGLAAGARGTAEFFLKLFVMLYAVFFFLIDGRRILDAILHYTPLNAEDKERVLGTFTSVGRATIKGTLVIGLVQGGLAGLALWLAGIQGAIFWGTIMVVLSIIPGIGTALVWVPAVIFLALTGKTVAAIAVAIWCAVVVGTADNVLRPLLIGKDTQMPDLLVLLTTLGGLVAFGATGIVVGPLIGALFMTAWSLWGRALEEADSPILGTDPDRD
ncbi:MAG: AI-2E family transporter [Gammaproteobacteria bacterium]